jgi:two-component system OmpR family response regulator
MSKEPLRILVVDDEPAIAGLLPRLLDEPRYDMRTAGTAAEARRILDEGFVPDVVVLDIVLPDGNGLDLGDEMRARAADVPLLVVSGEAVGDASLARAEALADLFLEKPFEAEELETAVTYLVGDAH